MGRLERAKVRVPAIVSPKRPQYIPHLSYLLGFGETIEGNSLSSLPLGRRASLAGPDWAEAVCSCS